jgi:RND family efflux transporter MFP subunit
MEASKSLGMETADVDLRNLENTLTATATVVAPWKQHAYATTRVGGKLSRVFVRPGDFVEAGQKLAEIESLELANEQLELIQSKLELDLARQTLKRAETLGTKGIVSDRDVRTAQTTQLEKSSLFEVTRSKLIGLGISSGELEEVIRSEEPVRTLTIFSPESGVVVHGDANAGRIVEPTDHLFEILDLSNVWVKAMVAEAETYRIRPGQSVRVVLASLPTDTFAGTIDYISLQADSSTRVVPVWVSLKNRDARNPVIRPGMFGRMQIVTEQVTQRVTCPRSALVTAGAETYVFVQQKPPGKEKPGEYIKRNIVLGMKNRDWVEVKEGLFPGDQVVTKGSHELSSFFVQGVLTLTLEAQRNIKLRLEQVQLKQIEDVVTVNASVEIPSEQKAFASSLLPGRIARILVDMAQSVRAGDTVAEVESLEFQSLQLELIQTQARLNQIRKLLEGASKLTTTIAGQELLRRETEMRKSENQLSGLKRKLEAIGMTSADVALIAEQGKLFEMLPVRAPIDGYVVHFDVIPGQVVKAENPLFEIHDMSKVWIRGYVFERDMPRVQLNQAVRIRLASDPNFLAETKLVRTTFVLSAAERVLSVWAELDNVDYRIKQNMLARLTITAGSRGSVTAVPLAAVLTEGSEFHVFVKTLNAKDYFDRRPVRLGRRDDQYVEITEGLSVGEQVAIGGVQELRTAYASIK